MANIDSNDCPRFWNGNVTVPFKKEVILKLLLENKILIRDLDSYGLKQFIRVSIGSNEQMNKFMKTLENIMSKNAVKRN